MIQELLPEVRDKIKCLPRSMYINVCICSSQYAEISITLKTIWGMRLLRTVMHWRQTTEKHKKKLALFNLPDDQQDLSIFEDGRLGAA